MMTKNSIRTKFTIASEEGLDLYQFLGVKRTKEKYADLVPDADVELFIQAQFARERLLSDLNTFSNQLLIAYVNEEPAAYAFLKGNGQVPAILEGKRTICIDQFEVLDEFDTDEVGAVLLEKCTGICKSYEAIWSVVTTGSPGIELLYGNHGFSLNARQEYQIHQFPVPAALWIRENKS